MALTNRATPDGRIIAVAARGTLMGNRGILHDDNRVLGRARWRHMNWVTCRLRFKGRQREIMAPRRYTELFFLDEAVAFAAGHRPCGECRRADYQHFKALWEQVSGAPHLSARDLDRALHGERVLARKRRQRRHLAGWDELPPGAFVLHPDQASGTPFLVMRDRLLPYTPGGYGAAVGRPGHGEAVVLTPPGTLNVFGAGYRPALHPSAL